MRFFYVLGVMLVGISTAYPQVVTSIQPRTVTLPQIGAPNAPVFPRSSYQADGLNRSVRYSQVPVIRLNERPAPIIIQRPTAEPIVNVVPRTQAVIYRGMVVPAEPKPVFPTPQHP